WLALFPARFAYSSIRFFSFSFCSLLYASSAFFMLMHACELAGWQSAWTVATDKPSRVAESSTFEIESCMVVSFSRLMRIMTRLSGRLQVEDCFFTPFPRLHRLTIDYLKT